VGSGPGYAACGASTLVEDSSSGEWLPGFVYREGGGGWLFGCGVGKHGGQLEARKVVDREYCASYAVAGLDFRGGEVIDEGERVEQMVPDMTCYVRDFCCSAG
jgi:hypothetical protein